MIWSCLFSCTTMFAQNKVNVGLLTLFISLFEQFETTESWYQHGFCRDSDREKITSDASQNKHDVEVCCDKKFHDVIIFPRPLNIFGCLSLNSFDWADMNICVRTPGCLPVMDNKIGILYIFYCGHFSYFSICFRCGSRTGGRNGGRGSDICWPTQTSGKGSGLSLTAASCSPSLRTASRATATPATTTGRPRCPPPPSPRALPGASTRRWCTTNQGESVWLCQHGIRMLNLTCFFSMSTMGFNMSSMNSSSIMPSVTSISPTLNTSTVPYGSQHTPATTSYPGMYKDSMSVYKDSMSVYKDSMSSVYKDSMASTYPGMSSSIASLRLKAKQHQVAGFGSYSPPQPGPPLSPRSSCQYTGPQPGATPERPLI